MREAASYSSVRETGIIRSRHLFNIYSLKLTSIYVYSPFLNQ